MFFISQCNGIYAWKGKAFHVAMSIFSLLCTSVNDAFNQILATETDADLV